MNPDAQLTAAQASRLLPGVSRQLIAYWVGAGHLTAVAKTGRSPLYRWADLQSTERATRQSPQSTRRACA